MTQSSVRNRLLNSTMICGVFALAFAAAPALAQTTSQPPMQTGQEQGMQNNAGQNQAPQTGPVEASDEGQIRTDAEGEDIADNDVEGVVVTGSRIRRPNLVTASPVTQVTGEDIDVAGTTRVEELINELPQAFAAQNANISNGASGTATVDLRGLGSVRTLVLVDGRRLPFGSPDDPAADLNQIPGQLIDRVEVLTGGASAIYGSDAISGVVNFILKRNFEGVQVDAQYNFYQHNNGYDGPGNLRDVIAGRALTNPSQFALPDDNVADGQGFETTLLMGINSPDDRGNLTGYVGYRTDNAILQSERDYSACALGGTASQVAQTAATGNFVCGGSATSFPGLFTNFGVGGPGFFFSIGPNRTFRAFNSATDQFNFGPLNFFQRPSERYILGALGRYEFNDRVEAFTQLMFTDYQTIAQIAPSGNFFNTETINCGNPLLSPQQRTAILCTPAQVAADERVPLFIGRRNVEGGGRQDDLRYQAYRALIGLRGDLGGGFDYDIAASFARVQLSQVYRNEFSTVRLGRALDVVTGADGQPVCRSTTLPQGDPNRDPNCVPFDIFALGALTPEARNYVQINLVRTGATQQQLVTAALTGDLGETFGIASPLAGRGVQFAVGAEYRRDLIESNPDIPFQTGEGAGQGGPTTPLSGAVAVNDVFAELEVPLIEDRPYFQELSINGAYRYSDFNTGVSTDTYAVNGIYQPFDAVRFRGTYARAVRAANVIELFETQGFALFGLEADPCGPARTATLQQCVATGVPAALYGSEALDSPAGQYNQMTGGNPNLQPEEADTVTFGVVFTPRFLPGFDLTVDYFDIQIEGLVSAIGAQNTLTLCYEQNDPAACARINRNPGGSLFIGEGFVENLNINIGGLSTSGIDVNSNFTFPLDRFGPALGRLGRLALTYTGTFLNELETDTGVGRVYDCVGFFANECGQPNPEYRHRARATLQTPIDLDLNLTWRYFGEVEMFEANPPNRIDRFFEEQSYIDLAATYRIMDRVSFRTGVNNIFDEDPPISPNAGNGNTYPNVYDALGRYIFFGITADF